MSFKKSFSPPAVKSCCFFILFDLLFLFTCSFEGFCTCVSLSFFQKWLKRLKWRLYNTRCVSSLPVQTVSPCSLKSQCKKMCIFHRTLPTCKVYVDIANCCCDCWTCYLFLYISHFNSVSLYILLPLFSQQCFRRELSLFVIYTFLVPTCGSSHFYYFFKQYWQ